MFSGKSRCRWWLPGSEVLLTTLLVVAILLLDQSPATQAVVTIEHNGYKGLVVAINKDVPENPRLVNRIKEVLTDASGYLHGATRHRAYFNEVTIVVPPTWSPSLDYEVVQGGDRFSRAEVRVDAANQAYGDQPYTLQPGECGEPGDYIHIPPEFLLGAILGAASDAPATDNDTAHHQADAPAGLQQYSGPEWPYGNPAKVFVHEWAHLRYGTFDEHGYQGDQQMPAFYLDSSNMIRPTGCTEDIRGWLRDMGGDPCVMDINGIPNDNCVFYPEEGGGYEVMMPGGPEMDGGDHESIKEEHESSNKKPSMMYMPSLDSADGFCDDESEDRKHNPFAPNKQNLMCQGRSTWDVISKHPDFSGDSNPPNNLVSTIPKFRVIQPKKNQRPTFVLVLDVSGSMRGRRMELLRAATSRFIKFQLADFCTVGMVAFSTGSRVLANMTTMEDSTREVLLTQVPLEDDTGFTAIGLGIQQALELLRQSREPTEGTLLLLVSDGEENVEPYVNTVLPKIRDSRVIINTIAFGRHASNKLESLVQITGGRGFFYDDEKVSHQALETAFVESAATHADIDLQAVEIVNRHISLAAHQSLPREDHFTIDKDVGKSTVFLVTYDYPVPPSEKEPLEVLLWSPTGKKYSEASSEYQSDRNTLSISIKISDAEAGKWKYWVKNKQPEMVDVTVLVTTETKDIREQPIRVRSWVSDVDFSFPSRVKIYAEVKKGYNAIVDATVISTVGRPQGEPWIMMLSDNGAGADNEAGDGIYSGYFAHFNGSGRYSVEAVVVNNGRARVNLGSPQHSSRAPRLPIVPRHKVEELGEPKSAFSHEELLEPTNAQLLEDLQREEDEQNKAMQDLRPVDEFERFASAGAFRLTDWKEADIIPPSRVIDLRVVEADLPSRTVHLEWTSPGDDMDDGRAELTEVRYHRNPLVLLQQFTRAESDYKLLEGDFRPPKSRQPHAVKLVMPPESVLQLNVSNFRLYIAVRTMDEAGNAGDVSNLALAHFRDPEALRVIRGDPDQLHHILLAVTAALACVAVIVAIVLIVCKIQSNRKKKYECQKRTSAGDTRQMDKLLA